MCWRGRGVAAGLRSCIAADVFPAQQCRPGHHPADTTVLAFAALASWLRAEVFPRVLPGLDEAGPPARTLAGWQAFILPCASWLGLGSATAALWVWMPDQWLPLGWIALFRVLVILGHRFKAVVPALEGDILALLSAGVLVFHHVLPLVFLRFANTNPDPSRHPALTAVLSIAALAFWSRAELLPRFLPKLNAVPNWDPAAWEAVMLPLASCIGTASAAAALWVVLPAAWVAVGWLASVLVLGFASDWIASGALALQADALAVVSLLGLAGWDLWHSDWSASHAALDRGRAALLRNETQKGRWCSELCAGCVLLGGYDISAFPRGRYFQAAMGRADSRGDYPGPLRNWPFHTQGVPSVAGLCAVCRGGLKTNSDHLLSTGADPSRHFADHFSLINSCLLEVLILATGGYWLYERTRQH